MGTKRTPTSLIEGAYRNHARSLTRFLSRFLDSRVDIEDVLQEAFLKALEAERNVQIEVPLAYLFKTAKNLALNSISQRRRQRTDPVADFEELSVLYDRKLVSDVDPESQNLMEEQLALAGDVLEQLTPRVREVFVLRKVYGFSHKEIAKYLDIAVSTVEKHIVKGMLEMKRNSTLQDGSAASTSMRENHIEGGSGGKGRA